ncbi:hypothetical protein ANCCEY_04387 [Ancylostoma ceylanicum]|uniref:Uncharacterized protein n=1 Tax=Ancylostoma ceylanicum TaxID=53326 RepID=A0A0D6M9F9_9BILA|nr:hypothetical protein ANCCEY_04387 [Ancylostoma ceylanicum]
MESSKYYSSTKETIHNDKLIIMHKEAETPQGLRNRGLDEKCDHYEPSQKATRKNSQGPCALAPADVTRCENKADFDEKNLPQEQKPAQILAALWIL